MCVAAPGQELRRLGSLESILVNQNPYSGCLQTEAEKKVKALCEEPEYSETRVSHPT